MAVISLLSQKGGVGKSSICYHLSGALAAAGRRVLVIDNAPYPWLTHVLLGSEQVGRLDASSTIAAVYMGLRPRPVQILRKSGIPGVDLIPGSREINRFDTPDLKTADGGVQHELRRFMVRVRDCYDLVLMDNSPGLLFCAAQGLLVSDGYIVPVQPEDFGMATLNRVQSFVDEVRGRKSGIRMMGYLLNLVDPKINVHRVCEQQLRRQHGDGVFATALPNAFEFPEAVARKVPVRQWKPRSLAAWTIDALVEEIDWRLAGGASRVP